MTTKIIIGDVACYTEVLHDGNSMTVIVDCGGDPRQILAGVDFSAPLPDLARAVMAAWCSNYDGSPSENNLRIQAERNGKEEVFYA